MIAAPTDVVRAATGPRATAGNDADSARDSHNMRRIIGLFTLVVAVAGGASCSGASNSDTDAKVAAPAPSSTDPSTSTRPTSTGPASTGSASTGPAQTVDPEIAAVYAATVQHVALIDNTFGGGGVNPFKNIELRLNLDRGPRLQLEPLTPPRTLADGRVAIPEPEPSPPGTGRPTTQTGFDTLRVVAERLSTRADGAIPATAMSPAGWADLTATDRTRLVASIRLSSVAFEPDGTVARVVVEMWCGDLCGWYTQYVLDKTSDRWLVRGIEGPTAVA